MNRRHAIQHLAALTVGALALPPALRANPANVASGTPPTLLPAVTFHNLAELEPLADGGWRMSRVPAALWPRLNENAQRRAYATAGVELRFNLEGDEARVALRFVESRGEATRGWPLLGEVYWGDYFARWFEVRTEGTEIVIRRPANADQLALAADRRAGRFDPTLVRVVLPCLTPVELLGIEGEVSPARPDQVPARRYLAYGSSITNGATAMRPGDTYPARIARSMGVDHFNLGFGGGAHLEPEMADWIAGRSDWDFATLELGINLVGRVSTEEFARRVNRFLPRIAAAHPEKWIFCIDLFWARGDLGGDPKYPQFRDVVREAVERLGLLRVRHCDGRELLTRPTGLTLDLLHPSSDGFEEIAEKLVAVMQPAVRGG
jgi:lysophospholipase L1-like esterase